MKILKKIDNGLDDVKPEAAENAPVPAAEPNKNGG